MAESGISAPAEGRVKIVDAFLDANRDDKDVVIDIQKLTPPEAFENVNLPGSGSDGEFCSRGISIGNARVASQTNEKGYSYDATSSYATINGCLNNDPLTSPMTERFSLFVTHPVRFRYIYPYFTNARDIVVKA